MKLANERIITLPLDSLLSTSESSLRVLPPSLTSASKTALKVAPGTKARMKVSIRPYLKPVYKATLALDPPREVVLGAEVAKLSSELKEMKASYSRAQVLNEKLNIAFSGAGGRYEWMVWQSAGCGKERVGSSRA